MPNHFNLWRRHLFNTALFEKLEAIAFFGFGPTLGRIIFFLLELEHLGSLQIPYLVVITILLSLIFWDKKNQKNYKPYLVALAAFSIYLISLYVIDVNLNI